MRATANALSIEDLCPPQTFLHFANLVINTLDEVVFLHFVHRNPREVTRFIVKRDLSTRIATEHTKNQYGDPVGANKRHTLEVRNLSYLNTHLFAYFARESFLYHSIPLRTLAILV